ncbi:hypothetical protein GCM10012275_09700 [Longimycelium tulufanense]|uniref:DoxX family protein n=1 Tax=Longimycelium tulufanense TaxID=907463 RepID=A0A8J3CAX0_9PSEU|nr:DoxX family protein [Longimycelium tulufanense]GGM40821.1 hypothetical protein GCM10012275_09700 [Longimycelium tulufanense]
MTTISAIRGRCQQTTRRLHALGWLPNLVLRVSIGFMFASGAVGKLADLAAFTRLFEQLGVPQASWAAPVVALIELVGGLGLMAGAATRLSALALAAIMIGATLTAVAPPLHDKYPTTWDFLSNLFYSPEWLLACLLAWLVCAGAGKASVDALVSRRIATSQHTGHRSP